MGRSIRRISSFFSNLLISTRRKMTSLFSMLASIRADSNSQNTNPTISKREQYRKYVKEKLPRRKQKVINSINRKNANKKSKNIFCQLLLSHKVEQFCCPICMEFLVIPVSTPCGHTYCFQCLEQLLTYKTQCSVCRENIKNMEITTCQLLSKILFKKAKISMNEIDFKHYQQRLQKNIQWHQKRKIGAQSLSVGQHIDVRDADHIWCAARINKIYKNKQNKVISILVVFENDHKFAEEIIEISSKRLAPYRFFTKPYEQRLLYNPPFGFFGDYHHSSRFIEIIEDFNDSFLMGHLPIQIEQSPMQLEARQVNNLLNAQVIIPLQSSAQEEIQQNNQDQPNENN